MTRILVIEDETILRGEIVEWLTLEDYEAAGAADGVEGLNAVLNHPPDLIICDIAMPRLDGFGVLLEMHANPDTADIPFIFVTARATHEDVRMGMGLGADDYITKPFTRSELLQAIRIRLEKKSAKERQHQREIEQWQRAFEQKQEQLLLKSKLVAMFSHDFRNPLATILASNSLLRDYADRMDGKRRLVHMNRIEASVRQLMQMLDDMMVVSQMETGNFDFKPEPLNVAELIGLVVEEFRAIHGETHTLVLESDFSDPVAADPRLLHQIATNLISNAIKYSPRGGEVRVTMQRRDNQFALAVQDWGIGIPDADQAAMFTAFQRASNVGGISGTGLGLVIVKQAVDLHSGSVSLDSRVDVGTTVTVSIPL